MIVVYQDDLGIACVEIDTRYGVTFDGRNAYFTDTDNSDYTVPVSQLVKIG